MKSYIVVENKNDWSLEVEDAEVVLAEEYLTSEACIKQKTAKVFNLCRSYRYQSMGYYVSLLAAARGHKPLPSVSTIVDFRLVSMVRLAGEELQDMVQKALSPIQSDEFTLSIYFGRNTAKRYDRLAGRIFRLFPAPLIRCSFVRDGEEGWRLRSIRPLSTSEIAENHHEVVQEFAKEFFAKRPVPESPVSYSGQRCSLAVLYNSEPDSDMPIDEKALARLKRAAAKNDVYLEVITKDDYGRLLEFDALFIRETTNVNHHTFRFARRAQAEGLVVIDDPDSILRCSNKVFLAELLTRAKIPIPQTTILHKGNLQEKAKELPLPCILKQPDSAFSRGVIKVKAPQELLEQAGAMLEKSGLVIAQEFMPTEFDWRVGILDGEPLYVCRYHMARNHWQIVQRDAKGTHWGKTETLPLWQAPPVVIRTALQAANLIGDGLYGVDVKAVGDKAYIIEVNDNPDIISDYEDAVLKEELYQRLIDVFLKRVDAKRRDRKATP